MLQTKQKIALVLFPLIVSSWAGAQTATTKGSASTQVVVERRRSAPQVITVLHRINRLTLLRSLVRSGQQIGAFQDFDEVFDVRGAVHTNIIAGLALDDGYTIAAWLPEAEVETEPMFPFSPQSPAPDKPAAAVLPSRPAPRAPVDAFGGAMFYTPDIRIVGKDGRTRRARYVGLDGITGLSLLQLADKTLPAQPISTELPLSVGQRLRLYFPEPVGENAAATNNSVYVRLGENNGEIISVSRGGAGEVSRLKIRAAKLSASNIGAVVVNDGGQTIGIVESVDEGEANVLSPAAIRAAAKRVLDRQASVPKPWLGISGEPIAFTSVERIMRKGWENQKAQSLFQARRGILLNSVAPGSPAALAALQDGDVIVRVNNNDVKTKDDFSLLLADAAFGPVNFTVVRRNSKGPETILIQLSQQLDSMSAVKMLDFPPRAFPGSPLLDQGIETVPVRPLESPLTGRANGLLVLFVEPNSAPFKAGLVMGDVIEAIDGKPISLLTAGQLNLATPTYTLNVVRKKERLVLTVLEDEK